MNESHIYYIERKKLNIKDYMLHDFFKYEIQKNAKLIYSLEVMIVWTFRGMQWQE